MPNNSPEVERGLQLLQEGDATGAITLFEQATAASPDDGLAFQYLGVARSQAGDFIGGARALQQAAKLLPDRPSVWFNFGVALSRIGENDKARIALRNALALDPDNTKARAALDALPPSASGPVATRYAAAAPTTGLRILRGLGWGPIWGQWWTLMIIASRLLFNMGHFFNAEMMFYFATIVVVHALVGGVLGVIIALAKVNIKNGAICGIVAGLLLFGLDLLNADGFSITLLINLYFWVMTGRYVGANIAKRVQGPVAR